MTEPERSDVPAKAGSQKNDSPSFIDARVASFRVRLSFEQAATGLALAALAIALGACLVSLWPAGWAAVVADHINRIKGAIDDFIICLGSLLGVSWGRGHLDARLESLKRERSP